VSAAERQLPACHTTPSRAQAAHNVMAVTFSAVLLGGIEPLAPVTVALIKNSSSHWLPPSCGHLRVEDDNEVSCEGQERSRCLCKVQAQHKARASAGHTHRQGLGSPAASLRRFGHQASVALQSPPPSTAGVEVTKLFSV